MDHEEFKKAREELGLSLAELGVLLGEPGKPMSADKVRRYETRPDKGNAREISAQIARLMQIYLDGYRPPDWPTSGEK